MFLRRFSSCLMLVVLCISGCSGSGEPIADVSGTVTLNGTPVPQTQVMFEPTAGGRSSVGMTDADGNYTLTYLHEGDGALIGEHLVRLTTRRGTKRDDQGRVVVAGVEEKFPPEYNSESTQKVTVESGDNEINFDVVSD